MPRVNSKAECRPIFDPWLEVVNGTIIGGEDDHEGRMRYRFYDRDGKCFHAGELWFYTDAEAEAYCKAQYPEHYKRGVEMRQYYD